MKLLKSTAFYIILVLVVLIPAMFYGVSTYLDRKEAADVAKMIMLFCPDAKNFEYGIDTSLRGSSVSRGLQSVSWDTRDGTRYTWRKSVTEKLPNPSDYQSCTTENVNQQDYLRAVDKYLIQIQEFNQ